jgi:peroxiredoxin (alkyl hydroperoxide reductase subunit C)
MSVDSVFSHKIWQEEELSKMIEGGVPYPMLSDAGGKVGKLYGVLSPPVGRNVAELIRQVQAFQHVRETGEVIPSGWQPGKPTLKPGPDLAGKVWKVWKPEKIS